MIHIVFNEADIAVLHQAIALDNTLEGKVIQIKDDFAVGPLHQIYSEEGIADRKQWWRDALQGGDYEGLVDNNGNDDATIVAGVQSELRENQEEIIWLWAAQNKHDVSGYYWLLFYLKEFQGRVFILYLNNLPFINEKGNIFYPSWLHQIPAKEFLKAKKLAREITPSEFEVDPDEWTKLCEENKGVRLLEGGKKLIQKDYDYYDKELQQYISTDWQKAFRIISQFLNKGKNVTGDAYLLWRLKIMIAQDLYDVQGKPGNMRDFEVKLKGE